jgi:hypothetical protein
MRVARADLGGADAVGDELGVDPALPDTAGDQLRILAAQIENEDGALLRLRFGSAEGDDLTAGNWGPPS